MCHRLLLRKAAEKTGLEFIGSNRLAWIDRSWQMQSVADSASPRLLPHRTQPRMNFLWFALRQFHKYLSGNLAKPATKQTKLIEKSRITHISAWTITVLAKSNGQAHSNEANVPGFACSGCWPIVISIIVASKSIESLPHSSRSLCVCISMEKPINFGHNSLDRLILGNCLPLSIARFPDATEQILSFQLFHCLRLFNIYWRRLFLFTQQYSSTVFVCLLDVGLLLSILPLTGWRGEWSGVDCLLAVFIFMFNVSPLFLLLLSPLLLCSADSSFSFNKSP